MIERQMELRRRRHRRQKMLKFKAKLAKVKDGKERDAILKKIHVLSPWWTEPAAAK
jgi:alcohol dehydrogenase YqhD (iron-dependent ADH family)